MKVKEVDRTANVAWSLAQQHPIYLAAGTAAQQLDATFSTSAALEIYALNLKEPGLEMGLQGSLALDHRFNKIAWGGHGMTEGENVNGVIVGGTDTGNLYLYDPAKLINGDNAEIFQSNKHAGPIYSLDFNQFQSNLLVSGGTESEILIWDLNNPDAPMNPGAKTQPPEEVSCVAWNKQVHHILASTFPARCVVWDLRKNEPIIKVADSTARLRCKVVAWHPDVATQLCLASEDDHSPVIQLWDLRFATSPLKSLESHQRGILSIAWCQKDPDLLLSCGKDNRILCWNPNSNVAGGEVVCELATNNQWSFEVAWCPRNPAVIASSSFDGHVSVYSLMGGQQQTEPSSKIAESFPGSDPFAQPPVSQSHSRSVAMPLKKPPKWLRRPVGVSFGFGGKLVSFTSEPKVSNATGSTGGLSSVYISQVVTETEIVANASRLDEVLKAGRLAEFCQNKIEGSQEVHQKMIWSFLHASFEDSPRSKMLSILGYDPMEVSQQLKPFIKSTEKEELSQELNNLDLKSNASEFDEISFATNAAMEEKIENIQIKAEDNSPAGLLIRALLTGNIDDAVELSIQNGDWANALVLAQAGGAQLMTETQKRYLKTISNSAQLISAVVTSDWMHIVRNCDLDCWKEALAAVLTYAKPEEFSILCETLAKRLEQERNGVLVRHAMLCYVCAGNLESLTDCWLRVNDVNVNTSLALQDLIEQVMVLKKTVEMLGGQPTLKVGSLSRLLGEYVIILASQGSLALASSFINDASESLAILRDRLSVAINASMQSHYGQTNAVPNHAVQTQGNKLIRAPSLPSSNQYQQSYQPQTSMFNPMKPAPAPVPAYDFFNPASQAASIHQQHQPQVMNPGMGGMPAPPQMLNQTMPHAPTSTPTPPPPPPPSGSDPNSQSKSHMSQRYPRHLPDPSVYSEPSYGTSYGQQGFGYNQPQAPFGGFQPSQPQQTYFSMEQSSPQTFNHCSSMISGGSVALPSNFVPSVAPTIAPAAYVDPKPGWNDPPPLKSIARKPSLNFEQPQMLNPMMPAPNQIPNPMDSMPQNQMMGSFMPNQHQTFQPAPVNVQPSPMPQQQTQSPPPQLEPEPVLEKGPIPPEHQVLQDIFEDLRQQCQQAATNPQMRRKLDDVARKLENLYDKLRDNSLSGNTLLGLHQIIQSIQGGDYPSSLALHTQLVATTNFAETSSFMLGLKVLLQTAQQLGVYLR